jgi:hypothetical protein
VRRLAVECRGDERRLACTPSTTFEEASSRTEVLGTELVALRKRNRASRSLEPSRAVRVDVALGDCDAAPR